MWLAKLVIYTLGGFILFLMAILGLLHLLVVSPPTGVVACLLLTTAVALVLDDWRATR